MKPQLFEIPGRWKGKLYIVARPRGGDWLDDELASLHGAGVDVLVSLLEPQEAGQLGLGLEEEAAVRAGLEFFSLPVKDRGVPYSRSEFAAAVSRLEADLESGRAVAIHCRQSVGRAGMAAVAILVESGVCVEEAVELVSKVRGVAVPETAEQLEWLRGILSGVRFL